jgi:hypothetical protein
MSQYCCAGGENKNFFFYFFSYKAISAATSPKNMKFILFAQISEKLKVLYHQEET